MNHTNNPETIVEDDFERISRLIEAGRLTTDGKDIFLDGNMFDLPDDVTLNGLLAELGFFGLPDRLNSRENVHWNEFLENWKKTGTAEQRNVANHAPTRFVFQGPDDVLTTRQEMGILFGKNRLMNFQDGVHPAYCDVFQEPPVSFVRMDVWLDFKAKHGRVMTTEEIDALPPEQVGFGSRPPSRTGWVRPAGIKMTKRSTHFTCAANEATWPDHPKYDGFVSGIVDAAIRWAEGAAKQIKDGYRPPFKD